MTAAPIQIGAVYVEEDLGSDQHGDSFYVTFQGGAPNTQLDRLVIDGDLAQDGFSLGDVFFDTLPSGLGADHAFGFLVEELNTADPNASVRATVQDGTTRLVLDFENFRAGDSLKFSIDVDEVQFYDPSETDISRLNDNFDPITSGVEFQNSILEAEFSAPHFQDANGSDRFLNRYDDWLDQSQLPLPRDNQDGKRDRSAGAGFELQQQVKPISLSGTVYVDANEDLSLQTGEQRLSGVRLDLFRLEGGQYVSTGYSTTTDSNGNYEFGTNLGLEPGTYQVRETQPAGYYSVGATAGLLVGSSLAIGSVDGPNVLTEIDLLLGDQHAINLNFAENQPSALSGTVCYVVTGSDCFAPDATKELLEGVLIELRDATGNVIATETTDANGNYRFTGLRAGTYSVFETTPPHLLDGSAKAGSVGGTVSSGSAITQIVLGGGVTATGYDFCELSPSEISGHVYFDQDNDGRRDAGELLLPGVEVTLWDDAGNQIAQTTTDAQGFYSFRRLRPGQYRVTEQTPDGYLPGRAAVGTIAGSAVGRALSNGDVIEAIELPAGASGINYDFGEILAGSISGRVIVDTNGNCVIDAIGEMPLAGVTVQLLDAGGTVITTTTTDSNGQYRFDDLLPGSYSVREIQPAGYFHGSQSAGSGGGDDSIVDLIQAISVGPGADLVNYDFCDVPPASISGVVFVDSDLDCFQDPGEVGISDVEIALLDASGNVVATTRTDSSGRYVFQGLRAGDYTIRETQPAGYLHGGQRAGTGGGDDSQADLIRGIALTAGQQLEDYDFCEWLPGSISGIVFADLDFDCVQDADEISLSNVTIELLDASGNVVAVTQTDASGRYEFSGLRPDTYTVRETQPDGYFQGRQTPPTAGSDVSVPDLIQGIVLLSGANLTDANFCEIPPAEISGYVFQDGPPIFTQDGTVPEDIRSIRDGERTADDQPIQGVTLQLRTLTGAQIESSRALPGIYNGQFIEVQTDANGYFVFSGIRSGAYHVYQDHPEGYEDSLDTPGTTTGFAVNRGETVPSSIISLIQLSTPGADPGSDAILAINVDPGQVSRENNFSEVIAQPELPPLPPPPPPTPPVRPIIPVTPNYVAPPPLTATPLQWTPAPLLVGVGHEAPQTWHLSIINGGFPRGARTGEPIDESTVERYAQRLDVYGWTVSGLSDSTWRIVSTHPDPLPDSQRLVFHLPGASPLAGDFNGDGYSELALFLDGEWFIDLNANGRWDEADIWLKLGSKGDQPVIGDWDGDGKDDVGVFGRKWQGDERALAAEPGLPDPENRRRIDPKNVPPTVNEAPDDPRLLQHSRYGPARADLIDHVFRFGSGRDIAVSGDLNGDGIASIGVFREGRWTLDIDGNGRLTPGVDHQVDFGQPGDLPIIGDFDGDGVDELAIVRGNQVIVDSNGNGHVDATDQVFLLDSEDGTVIVGDFDGDGRDEPALHQSTERRVTLEARRAG